MKVERSIEICAAHRLYGYNGACSNLHGHNYNIALIMSRDSLAHKGDANNGMFVDFKKIKEFLKILESLWDHRLLLWEQDPLLSVLADQAFYAFKDNPTAENMVIAAANVFNDAGILDLCDSFTIAVEETKNNTAHATFTAKDFA